MRQQSAALEVEIRRGLYSVGTCSRAFRMTGTIFASVASPAAMEKLTEALLADMAASRLPHEALVPVLGALFGGTLWIRSDVR